MKRILFMAFIGVLVACPNKSHAQRSDEAAIAAGILGIVGESIRAANNNRQQGFGNSGWNPPTQRHGGAAPAPNSSGSQNLGNFSNNSNFFRPNSGLNSNTRPGRRIYSQPSVNRYYTPDYGTPYYSSPNSGHTIYSTPRYSSSVPSYSRSTPSYSDPPVAPKVYSRRPIVIRCPSSEFGICSYQLLSGSGKSYDYTLTPGQKQEFSETTDWKIRYDQGNGAGTKTYRLRGGREYEIRKTPQGLWAFYQSS